MRNRGFTLIELLIALAAIASLGLALAGAWIAIHFIMKLW